MAATVRATASIPREATNRSVTEITRASAMLTLNGSFANPKARRKSALGKERVREIPATTITCKGKIAGCHFSPKSPTTSGVASRASVTRAGVTTALSIGWIPLQRREGRKDYAREYLSEIGYRVVS